MSCGIDDLEHFKRLAEQADKQRGGACPNCGYCPTCGRRASPWQPYPMYPQWPTYPYPPYYVEGPSVTFGGTQ